jgi:hypothetical protein
VLRIRKSFVLSAVDSAARLGADEGASRNTACPRLCDGSQ